MFISDVSYNTRNKELELGLELWFSYLKAGPLRLKQLTNTLKIRILSETSILYLIRYASIILIVGLRL